MADVTVLEDGTEVCLPLPDSWSDSDDEEADAGPADAEQDKESAEAAAHGGGAAVAPAGRSAGALEVLAGIPDHNHARRHLAQPGEAAAAALDALAELEPVPEQACEVVDWSVSKEDFARRFVGGPGRPAVIKGVPEAEAWPAAERWRSQRAFLERYGRLPVQVTEMSALHGLGRPYRVELPLEEYVAYAGSNEVDWPYYVWERNFVGERRQMLEDFWAPGLVGDDLYDTTPEIREFLPLTCHLFVLVGGRRTGSNMHTDPKWSSAWNTLLCGCKRWVLFPRDVAAADIGAFAGDAYKDGGPPAYWWVDHYPRLRAQGAQLGMVDILQRPGDTIFIPAGWWHATLNLPGPGEDVTLACTRNVLPPASLAYVLPRMRAADPGFARTFVETLRRLRRDAPEFLPQDEALVERPAVVGSCESWMLRRRCAEQLSLAECRREFIRKGKPLIIDGLGPHTLSAESCGLSREWLSSNFGEKCVAVYRNFQAPELRRGEDDRTELVRLREALACLRRGGAEARGLYLYDVSLPLQLPGLLEHVKLPRYFSHCYLQQTMRPHCFSKSWPTLFIGAEGSQAKLHVDQWHGHFWMHMVSGRKHWTVFHPDDAHLLAPTVPPGKHHPVFPSLADLESGACDAPRFREARRIDVDLEEGETLFVPGGAPHLVVNLTDTVAVAGNFMDESNYDQAMADIQAMAADEAPGGPMAGVAAALGEIDFEPDRAMHEELLPARLLVVRYRDFAGGTAATWGPVPPGEEDDVLQMEAVAA